MPLPSLHPFTNTSNSFTLPPTCDRTIAVGLCLAPSPSLEVTFSAPLVDQVQNSRASSRLQASTLHFHNINSNIISTPPICNMRLTVSALLAIATTAFAGPVIITPLHPALRPDVQALLAAADLPTPPTSGSSPPKLTSKNCGLYLIKGGWAFDLNADRQCSDIEAFEIMHQVYNDKCGLCVTFQWPQCVGDITWSGKTANTELVDIPDSRSWWCWA
ncbi:hypothetical protein E8E12_009067 [Didymella heteroderae]|uniref:Uncharacterized protein n=1 Tax=Didymella heteroderae TaxID=1769908 RepID=A0A9P4WQS5_9PLEO|nr:hypothetical protein E8E12_009067 [Didymella heteroderae]